MRKHLGTPWSKIIITHVLIGKIEWMCCAADCRAACRSAVPQDRYEKTLSSCKLARRAYPEHKLGRIHRRHTLRRLGANNEYTCGPGAPGTGLCGPAAGFSGNGSRGLPLLLLKLKKPPARTTKNQYQDHQDHRCIRS